MNEQRIVSVIGLGYVGLPVAVAFGKRRKTIGLDINVLRIKELQSGYDRTDEVTGEDLVSAGRCEGTLRACRAAAIRSKSLAAVGLNLCLRIEQSVSQPRGINVR